MGIISPGVEKSYLPGGMQDERKTKRSISIQQHLYAAYQHNVHDLFS